MKLLALCAVTGATGVVMGGIWLSILLIIDPNAALWLNRYLPKDFHIPMATHTPPQTLNEIREELIAADLIMGQVIRSEDAILLPVWFSDEEDCDTGETGCAVLMEVRIYLTNSRNVIAEPTYRFLDRLVLDPLSEPFVFNPLIKAEGIKVDENKLYFFHHLESWENAPKPGLWLKAFGHWRGEEDNGEYGRILHYDPLQKSLRSLVPWTSPQGRSPQWLDIVGDPLPELVVNQGLSLYPEWEIYRLNKSYLELTRPDLQRLSLANPMVQEPRYQKAFSLVDQQLWGAASEELTQLRKEWRTLDPSPWTEDAQLQLDAINFQRKVWNNQCQTNWPQLGEKIISCLLASQTAQGFNDLEAAIAQGTVRETLALLTAHEARVVPHLENYRAQHPEEQTIYLWLAIFKALVNDRPSALTWFRSQPQVLSDSKTILQDLFNRLTASVQSQQQATLSFNHVLGRAQAKPPQEVRPLTWLQPQGLEIPTTATESQSWYEITVNRFFDGERWQVAPFELNLSKFSPAEDLWKTLGLTQDAMVNMRLGHKNLRLTVKGAQFFNGELRLLALADTPVSLAKKPTPAPWLVGSDRALKWVQPTALSVGEIQQLHPQWSKTILPALWNHFQATGWKSSKEKPPTPEALQQQWHSWQVFAVDLDGNQELEGIFQFQEGADGQLTAVSPVNPPDNVSSKVVILGDRGNVIYSELGPSQSQFMGIANVINQATPLFVLREKQQFSFKTVTGTAFTLPTP